MKVKKLLRLVFSNVKIYKESDNLNDITLFEGNPDHIPSEVLGLEVRAIETKTKGITSIQVY